jgi:hypothetical protein
VSLEFNNLYADVCWQDMGGGFGGGYSDEYNMQVSVGYSICTTFI